MRWQAENAATVAPPKSTLDAGLESLSLPGKNTRTGEEHNRKSKVGNSLQEEAEARGAPVIVLVLDQPGPPSWMATRAAGDAPRVPPPPLPPGHRAAMCGTRRARTEEPHGKALTYHSRCKPSSLRVPASRRPGRSASRPALDVTGHSETG